MRAYAGPRLMTNHVVDDIPPLAPPGPIAASPGLIPELGCAEAGTWITAARGRQPVVAEAAGGLHDGQPRRRCWRCQAGAFLPHRRGRAARGARRGGFSARRAV